MRQPLQRLSILLAAVIVAALLVAGCGGGGGGATDAGASGPTEATPTAEIPQELTIAFNQQITTLDPDKPIANADLNALHMIGGGLYEQQAEGKLVPALAKKSTTSKDKLTWTFQLRTDVKFSDGKPVTAADVVASFERALADESNINGAILGPIKSVSSSGPAEVTIKTERPYPSLPSVLSEEGMIVMPKEALEKEGEAFFRHPISFGPYELVSWQGPNAEFRANPNYWGEPTAVPTVRFRTVPDPGARVSQLRSGQIDFAFDIPPSYISTLASDSELHTEVVPSYGYYSISMWNEDPLLKEVGVRRAISLAIDRDKLTEVVWGGQNEPLAGYMPPTMEGYDPSIPTAADVDKAKEELEGTTCASGCELTLTYSPAITPWAEQAALLISNDLQQIGIKVSLVKDDGTSFVTDLFEGNYQLGLYGLADFIPQPDGLLPYGLSQSGGVNSNFTGYHNPEMEKLITETLSVDGAERKADLKKVNEKFVEEQPFATIATWAYVSASRVPADVVSDQPSLLMEIARSPSGG